MLADGSGSIESWVRLDEVKIVKALIKWVLPRKVTDLEKE